MQRRRFIAILAGATGAVVGMVKGAGAVVTEARETGQSWDVQVIKLGGGVERRTVYGDGIKRIWFNRDLVYSQHEAQTQLKQAIAKALSTHGGQG